MSDLPMPEYHEESGEWRLESTIDQLIAMSGLTIENVLFDLEYDAIGDMMAWVAVHKCRFLRDPSGMIRIVFPDQDTALLFKLTFYR